MVRDTETSTDTSLEQDKGTLPHVEGPTLIVDEPPSIVNMGTSSEESRQVYDQWADNHERDIRKWGYTIPETVATLLSSYVNLRKKNTTLLDAGAGDGLSGVALRNAGFEGHMVGIDISPNMLHLADQRQCYDALRVVDLNEPLPFEENTFDVVTCVGTLTYVDPDNTPNIMREFVRVTRPGGWICYTNRTDKKGFADEERRLQDEDYWEEVEQVGPVPYLPHNPDYGDKVQGVVYLYRVL